MCCCYIITVNIKRLVAGCDSLTDYIAFMYDYPIIELQLKPCSNIKRLCLAAGHTNIAGGESVVDAPSMSTGIACLSAICSWNYWPAA